MVTGTLRNRHFLNFFIDFSVNSQVEGFDVKEKQFFGCYKAEKKNPNFGRFPISGLGIKLSKATKHEKSAISAE